MNISYRLKEVARMVTKGNRLADIGTDHGYVPIYLKKNDIIPSAIAMDINKGPLEKAAENIKQENVAQVTTRLSDGLKELKAGEADTVLIAGMGGELIVRILKDGEDILKTVKELILSPHSEWELVRKYLQDNGYAIVEEKMIKDQGKYYLLLKAEKGIEEKYTDCELKYGRHLINNKDEVLKEFLNNEHQKYKGILKNIGETAHIRKKELEEKVNQISDILSCM